MQLSVLVSADCVVYKWRLPPTVIHSTDALMANVVIQPTMVELGCTEGERCDTYFAYCLMPHSSTAVRCPRNEPGFTAVSTTTIVDGADINFSQPTVLGLSNPFNLTGISTAWEIMISLITLFNFTI